MTQRTATHDYDNDDDEGSCDCESVINNINYSSIN